jgi:hypothetical protein
MADNGGKIMKAAARRGVSAIRRRRKKSMAESAGVEGRGRRKPSASVKKKPLVNMRGGVAARKVRRQAHQRCIVYENAAESGWRQQRRRAGCGASAGGVSRSVGSIWRANP